MRDGIHWRGSNRGRCRQERCSSNQGFVQPSGRPACGRGASVLVGCLIFCFVTWILSRLRTLSPISSESLSHRAPARAIVFELYRYYRYPHGGNKSCTGRVHRRRRSLLEDNETVTSPAHEIFSEEELEQPFDVQSAVDDLTVKFDSLKRRSPECHNYHEPFAFNYDQEALSFSLPPIGDCPVYGGDRASDVEIQSFFVKVGLGYGPEWREYFLNIDTGSAATWVHCVGSGPILFPGPNGLFHPKSEDFLNCKNNQELCKDFQEGEDYPCDREHKFKCLYTYEYGDGEIAQGSIVVGDVSFELSDGSQRQATLAFGCTEGHTADGAVQEEVPYDGLLGIGPSPAGWLLQLHMLRIISEYVIIVCLEPEIGHLSSGPGSSVLEHVGFISFGDSYIRQAAKIEWTASIPPESTDLKDHDFLYSAWLLGFKYRDEVRLLEPKEQMGFDTGADHTYLPRRIFNAVVEILDEDAIGMGYIQTPDRRVRRESRQCWEDIIIGREPSAKHFGDLNMMFSSLGDDLATSDFVIKPEHYITLGGPPSKRRICFNMLMESDQGEFAFNYGSLGGEVMRGHLLIFEEQPRQTVLSGRIGWSSVTSCENLRDSSNWQCEHSNHSPPTAIGPEYQKPTCSTEDEGVCMPSYQTRLTHCHPAVAVLAVPHPLELLAVASLPAPVKTLTLAPQSLLVEELQRLRSPPYAGRDDATTPTGNFQKVQLHMPDHGVILLSHVRRDNSGHQERDTTNRETGDDLHQVAVPIPTVDQQTVETTSPGAHAVPTMLSDGFRRVAREGAVGRGWKLHAGN